MLLVERECNDVDDQAESLTGFCQHYEQLGCGRFHGSMWQLLASDGLVLREVTNRSLRELVTPPPEHLAMAIPLSVAEGSVFASRPLVPSTLMVLNALDEHEILLAGPMDLIGICLHRKLLARMAPAKLEWLEQAERQRGMLLAPGAAAAIQDVLSSVGRDAARLAESSPSASSEQDQLLCAAITDMIAFAMPGEEAARHIPRRAGTRQRVVRRAVDFMRANLQSDIGVAQICEAAFASRRSLQYCFEEFMHTSPQAFMRALRLNEARRVLRRRSDVPITVLANDLGFSGASNFSRHYRLMFGELPSATLRGSRPTAAAVPMLKSTTSSGPLPDIEPANVRNAR